MAIIFNLLLLLLCFSFTRNAFRMVGCVFAWRQNLQHKTTCQCRTACIYQPHSNSCAFIYTNDIRNTFDEKINIRFTPVPNTCIRARRWYINIVFFDGWRVNSKHHTPLHYVYVFNTLNKSNNWIKNCTWATIIHFDISLTSIQFKMLGSTVYKAIVFSLSFSLFLIFFRWYASLFRTHFSIYIFIIRLSPNEGQWLPWNIHYLLFACVTGS